MENNYPNHQENFDVVMLKKGVSSTTAKTDDFKRIAVVAASPLAAQLDDKVAAEKDHVVVFTVPSGVISDPEVLARRRELEGEPLDRTKL